MKKKIRIYLADLTYTQQTIAADVIPQAIGSIASYLHNNFQLEEQIKLFKYPEKLIDCLESSPTPDVIGFSNYIWNFDLSYKFCKIIKDKYPNIITIFGGPNFPIIEEEFKSFLIAHPKIDFYIQKEGEIAFLELIKSIYDLKFNIGKVKKLRKKSVFSISSRNYLNTSETEERITDLDLIPSPYSSGLLDEFFDGKLTPIIQTNRGCPFSCTFCVEGLNYYNKIRTNTLKKLGPEVAYIGKKMEKISKVGGKNDLFIADSNFGMYRGDISFCTELSKSRKDYNWPEYINVATGKNQKERVLEASKIIDGVLRLSGSVQSLDKDVLANVKRANISAEGLMDLALDAKNVGANSYSEIILALPGDTKEKHYSSVKTVIEAGFTNVLLFQLMILPGTELATLETRKKFNMNIKYRVLPRCYGDYELFGKKIVSAEIEEICIGTNTLDFEDYIECRKMHLMVSIFYNDALFYAILKLIRDLDLSAWKWIELLCSTKPSKNLNSLFMSFMDATKSELWDSKDELRKYVSKPGIINKLIDGEIGNNLLFVHKTRAINDYSDSIAEFVEEVTIKFFKESGNFNLEFQTFIKDSVKYHLLSMKNLFKNKDEIPCGKFVYDIESFINSNTTSLQQILNFRYNETRKIKFVHNETQKDIIERFILLFGSSDVAIGRILTKVHTKKIMRKPFSTKINKQENTRKYDFQLSGLQN